jgi:hypothetical protein
VVPESPSPNGNTNVKTIGERREPAVKVLHLKGGIPMLDIPKDIHSLTTFRRRSGDFMKQLTSRSRPDSIVKDAVEMRRAPWLI